MADDSPAIPSSPHSCFAPGFPFYQVYLTWVRRTSPKKIIAKLKKSFPGFSLFRLRKLLSPKLQNIARLAL